MHVGDTEKKQPCKYPGKMTSPTPYISLLDFVRIRYLFFAGILTPLKMIYSVFHTIIFPHLKSPQVRRRRPWCP